VFWDVTAVVVALVVLGMALEVKAKGKTSEAIKKLIGLQQYLRQNGFEVRRLNWV
jgi:Cu+-exporting ATPase